MWQAAWPGCGWSSPTSTTDSTAFQRQHWTSHPALERRPPATQTCASEYSPTWEEGIGVLSPNSRRLQSMSTVIRSPPTLTETEYIAVSFRAPLAENIMCAESSSCEFAVTFGLRSQPSVFLSFSVPFSSWIEPGVECGHQLLPTSPASTSSIWCGLEQ